MQKALGAFVLWVTPKNLNNHLLYNLLSMCRSLYFRCKIKTLKRVLFIACGLFFITNCIAQKKSKKAQVDSSVNSTSSISTPKKIDFSGRPSDHLLIQYGYDAWLNKPNYVRTGGFSRHFNLYLMADKQFKSNPHFSSAYGIGISSNNIFFDRQYVDVKTQADTMTFADQTTINGVSGVYEKFKLTSIYLTIPLELRFFTKPENPNKSWKFAVGGKVSYLLKAYSKGKNFLDSKGNSVFGDSYIQKEQSKKFFNPFLFSLCARAGWGNFSFNVDYSINSPLKDGAPQVNLLSLGLTVSGL